MVVMTASTLPWAGEPSVMISKSSSVETSCSPLRTRRMASTWFIGSFEMLPSVRLRTFLPSRKDSRSRMAGFEPRLGTISTCMATSLP